MQDSDFENVGQVAEDVPIKDLDAALVDVRELELDHVEKKKTSNESHHKLEAAKAKFMGLLKAAGKKEWRVEGYTGFRIQDNLKFRVPQGPMQRKEFLEFLKSEKVSNLLAQASEDVYYSYVSVNSQSLGPLCKKLKSLAADLGEDLELPGIMPPTSESKLYSLPRK